MVEQGSSAGSEDVAESADRVLAELLGVPVDEFVRVLGAGWRQETSLPEDTHERWFVAGEPPQLALGFDGVDVFLARPFGRWAGTHQLLWHFDSRHRFRSEDVHLRPEGLIETADQIVRRRRRSFRWCRICRELTAPEWFMRDEGYCMSCTTDHHHVVF
jgi:hypothetical protein